MKLKEKFEQEREYYPALAHWTYLDHVSGGLYPSYSIQAMKTCLDDMSENSMTFREFTETWDFVDEIRSIVAQIFHCKSDEVMYDPSSTQLLSTFVNGIGMKEGDNIITTANSHTSIPYIILNKVQDGVEVRFVHPREGVTEPEGIYRLVDEHTRAIYLCYMENTYGLKHDLKVYGELYWKNDIQLVVDATQATSAMRIDMEEMKIDFLITSSYKWLYCIFGVGFAYISRRLQKHPKLMDTGWSCSIDQWHKDTEHPVISEDVRRFECGDIDAVGPKGASKIISGCNELGADDMEQYYLSLVDYLYDRVEKGLKRTRIYGNFKKENRSSIVTLAMPAEWGMTDEKAVKNGIRVHRPAEGLLRVGFRFYNNTEGVNRLVDFLKACEQGEE